MKNKGLFFLGFLMGALAGAGGSYVYLKPKMEEQKKQEVDSVKETFDLEMKKITERNREEKEKLAMKIKDVTDNLGYTNRTEEDVPSFARIPSDVPAAEPPKTDILPPLSKLVEAEVPGDPYEITENEFGYNGYGTVTLNYYSDGTFTDDQDGPMLPEDIPITIGFPCYEALDEKVAAGFEDMYVRNDNRHTDYRISLIDITSEE